MRLAGHRVFLSLLAVACAAARIQALQFTAGGPGPRLMLIVHHDDAEREFAYDRQSHIGKLDKAWDEAIAKGWVVVSMKSDWKRIFSFQK
jgi:hypothetical protein